MTPFARLVSFRQEKVIPTEVGISEKTRSKDADFYSFGFATGIFP